MGKMGKFWNGLKPPLLMVVTQLILAGVSIVYKLAANDGMSLKIMIAYRLMFATVVMVPIALIFEREAPGKIDRWTLFQGFLCGLLGGSLGQNLYLQSLVYTSATFISAMINLAPAITFLLAVLLKMEKLGLETAAGKAKMLGTLVGIAGAMVFTFYKGVEINLWSTNVNILPHHQQAGHSTMHGGTFFLGAFLGFLCTVSMAMWLIVQAKMSMTFPYLCSSTALMCIMGSIQATLIAICSERDWSQWKLGWNVRLWAVAFAGIMGSCLMVFLITWGVRLKGPLYASVFNPLSLVFVAIVGSLVLDEKLHLGSILGGILIIIGLYLVIWGKAKEMKQINLLVSIVAGELDEGKKGRYSEENTTSVILVEEECQ